METTIESQRLYIVEFAIGFILVVSSIFVLLTVLFCTSFMRLFCDILFPYKSLEMLVGFSFTIPGLTIGLILIIDGYLRFRRIRMIRIKIRNNLPLESVPAKISKRDSCCYCIIIFFIVQIVIILLFNWKYYW